MTTSYQRRKADIDYLKVRGRQLEAIIEAMGAMMAKKGIKPAIPITGVISGDDPITDISAGDFAMRMMSRRDWQV